MNTNILYLDRENAFAGLWSRIIAFIFDYIIISLYIGFTIGVTVAIYSIYPSLQERLFGQRVLSQLLAFLIMTLPVTLYFAILEASSWQASWGKRMRGLQVVDLQGERLSFGRALGRTALKFVPWELAHTCIWQMQFADYEMSFWVMVGLVLVWVLVFANAISIAMTPQKQALYDRLAGTVVVKHGRE